MWRTFKTIKTAQPAKAQGRPQIYDLLQLSRKEQEARFQCRKTIRAAMGWKKKQAASNDTTLFLCAQIEGILLRRQAQDALLLYRMMRRERIYIFGEYIKGLPGQRYLLRTASCN